MNEPIWVSKKAVLAMHSAQLAKHGGSDGIRDEALLDSALSKPRNVFAYAYQPDIFRLAASTPSASPEIRHLSTETNVPRWSSRSLFWTEMAGTSAPQKKTSTSPSSTSATAPSPRRS
jgi:hypothetical protein